MVCGEVWCCVVRGWYCEVRCVVGSVVLCGELWDYEVS